MLQERMSPLEAILRRIAAAAPGPWYPRAYAKERGVEVDGLTYLLEHLWLDGLIQNTPAVEGLGAGVVLSPEGERVLQDPEALRRLREGRPLTEGDRGGIVRQAFRRERTPVVTRLLVALNLLVFGYGLHMASAQGITRDFLGRFPGVGGNAAALLGVSEILHRTGSVNGADLLAGQWWRLLTCAFVHIGALHLGMNMLVLWRAGADAEQMWGRLRYLVIYLTAAWAGSCLAMAYAPFPGVAGASGALCGTLAADAVWVFLNRRHIPGSVRRRAGHAIFINTVLLVVISLIPGISGWCHGGGALGGALAAVLLNFQRFGPARWRWLALPALAALPVLGVCLVQHQRAVNPKWQAVGKAVAEFNREKAAEKEDLDFEGVYDRPARQTYQEVETFYKENVQRLLEMNYKRRPPAEVEKVLPAIAEQRQKLAPLRDKLNRAGPYQTEAVEGQRQKRLQLVKALDDALWEGGQTLRDEAEQLDFETKSLPRIRQATKGAADLFERVEPLLAQRPARRPAAAVEKTLRELAESRRALGALAGHLAKAGPSRVELVETARKKALEYAQASAALLAQAERCLRAGDRWTEQDEEALQQQVKAVDKLRGEWNGLVE
jgi:membrane associated rhomboid family serine protease